MRLCRCESLVWSEARLRQANKTHHFGTQQDNRLNRLRNAIPCRNLPLWAASALIPAVLLAALALPAAPARADGPSDASPVEIECGDKTPLVIVEAGTTLNLAYFAGPGAEADSLDYTFAGGDAVQGDIWTALFAHVRADESIGTDWVCRGCAVPGACVVWPIEITPIGEPEWAPYFYLDRYESSGVWVVDMVITCDLAVSSICTEC